MSEEKQNDEGLFSRVLSEMQQAAAVSATECDGKTLNQLISDDVMAATDKILEGSPADEFQRDALRIFMRHPGTHAEYIGALLLTAGIPGLLHRIGSPDCCIAISGLEAINPGMLHRIGAPDCCTALSELEALIPALVRRGQLHEKLGSKMVCTLEGSGRTERESRLMGLFNLGTHFLNLSKLDAFAAGVIKVVNLLPRTRAWAALTVNDRISVQNGLYGCYVSITGFPPDAQFLAAASICDGTPLADVAEAEFIAAISYLRRSSLAGPTLHNVLERVVFSDDRVCDRIARLGLEPGLQLVHDFAAVVVSHVSGNTTPPAFEERGMLMRRLVRLGAHPNDVSPNYVRIYNGVFAKLVLAVGQARFTQFEFMFNAEAAAAQIHNETYTRERSPDVAPLFTAELRLFMQVATHVLRQNTRASWAECYSTDFRLSSPSGEIDSGSYFQSLVCACITPPEPIALVAEYEAFVAEFVAKLSIPLLVIPPSSSIYIFPLVRQSVHIILVRVPILLRVRLYTACATTDQMFHVLELFKKTGATGRRFDETVLLTLAARLVRSNPLSATLAEPFARILRDHFVNFTGFREDDKFTPPIVLELAGIAGIAPPDSGFMERISGALRYCYGASNCDISLSSEEAAFIATCPPMLAKNTETHPRMLLDRCIDAGVGDGQLFLPRRQIWLRHEDWKWLNLAVLLLTAVPDCTTARRVLSCFVEFMLAALNQPFDNASFYPPSDFDSDTRSALFKYTVLHGDILGLETMYTRELELIPEVHYSKTEVERAHNATDVIKYCCFETPTDYGPHVPSSAIIRWMLTNRCQCTAYNLDNALVNIATQMGHPDRAEMGAACSALLVRITLEAPPAEKDDAYWTYCTDALLKLCRQGLGNLSLHNVVRILERVIALGAPPSYRMPELRRGDSLYLFVWNAIHLYGIPFDECYPILASDAMLWLTDIHQPIENVEASVVLDRDFMVRRVRAATSGMRNEVAGPRGLHEGVITHLAYIACHYAALHERRTTQLHESWPLGAAATGPRFDAYRARAAHVEATELSIVMGFVDALVEVAVAKRTPNPCALLSGILLRLNYRTSLRVHTKVRPETLEAFRTLVDLDAAHRAELDAYCVNVLRERRNVEATSGAHAAHVQSISGWIHGTFERAMYPVSGRYSFG